MSLFDLLLIIITIVPFTGQFSKNGDSFAKKARDHTSKLF